MNKLRNLSNKTLYSLLAILASIIMVAFVTVTQWQAYRSVVDNNLGQYIQNITTALEDGAPAASLSSSGTIVDPREDLAPFIVAAKEDGSLEGSTMQIDGQSPVPDLSVLEKAKGGQHIITWHVHGAVTSLVIEHYESEEASGYVMVGQSLSQVTKQQERLLIMAGGTLVLLLAVVLLAVLTSRRQPRPVAKLATAAKNVKTSVKEAAVSVKKEVSKKADKVKKNKK